jgi:glycosyltransferase involved in cell wall biosynthesis
LRILQLVSDWKWTGPAEPMLVLTRALRSRGHLVDLVCPEPPADAGRSLWSEARARGVEPRASIEAGRSALRPGDRDEVRLLRKVIVDAVGEAGVGPAYDFVHCWHSRDHVLAARALGRVGLGLDRVEGTALVRTLSPADRVPRWPWNRWLLGPACDGLLCTSRASLRANEGLRGGRPIEAVEGAVEAERLEATRDAASVRAELGVSVETPLVGVVARIQSHRRFDLLLAAMQRVVRERPDARLVLIGRGTHVDAVARDPARRLGLDEAVILAGYRVDDYGALLRALDVFCFLVPGSDGGCRALLEAATLGLPLVGSRRGAIPEIVRDGRTGLVVDEDPERLAEAWLELISHEPRRRAIGEAAARDARARFAPGRLAEDTERFYAEVCAASCTPTSSR